MRPTLWLTAALMLVPSFAFAQAPSPTPQPNPQLNFCLKGGDQIAAQRNAALNDDAQCHVQLELINEDLIKARAEIEDLKKKLPPAPPTTPAPATPEAK
jgi:hypothetical protein